MPEREKTIIVSATTAGDTAVAQLNTLFATWQVRAGKPTGRNGNALMAILEKNPGRQKKAFLLKSSGCDPASRNAMSTDLQNLGYVIMAEYPVGEQATLVIVGDPDPTVPTSETTTSLPPLIKVNGILIYGVLTSAPTTFKQKPFVQYIAVGSIPQPVTLATNERPMIIEVEFDQPVDATTITPDSIILQSVTGTKHILGDVIARGQYRARFTVHPAPSTYLDGAANDEFDIIVRGSGTFAVKSAKGMALDGEFSTSLPSGNGTSGGDFTFRIKLA